MLGQMNCCAPQKTCYNNTYDDYEDLGQRGGGRNGFNGCRPSFKENLCNRIKRVQESSKILENVLDIASTLVKIMCVCGIHECKANKALDVIIYAFMHFDEVAEHPGGKCKKRIRKEEFYNDLMRDCGMTKAEAKLTYSIVKCAFKAFYHKQVVNRYDTGFVDECEWKNAANRTINAFAQSGATKSEVELTGRRILCAYENYICRLQSKRTGKDSQQDENKCICNRSRRNNAQTGGYGGGFGGDFGGGYGFDPCKPPCPPPEPPLCGELCCQLVCPPGSTCPQVVCKDACGRTFLRVDGNKINFDPFIMECEAKRAAMSICPPCDSDRIKSLRESLDVCRPKDVDSCDQRLAEICKEEEKHHGKGDICDETGDVGDDGVCGTDSDGVCDMPKSDGDNRDEDGDICNPDDEICGAEDEEPRGDRDTHREKERHDDKNKSKSESRHTTEMSRKVPDDTRSRVTESPSRITRPSTKKRGLSGPPDIAIAVKFAEEDTGGRRMEVDMQGYCPDGGHAPDDIRALRVIANDNPPLDFACTPLSAYHDTKSVLSARTMGDDTKSVKSIKSRYKSIRGSEENVTRQSQPRSMAQSPRASGDDTKVGSPLAASTPRSSKHLGPKGEETINETGNEDVTALADEGE